MYQLNSILFFLGRAKELKKGKNCIEIIFERPKKFNKKLKNSIEI